MKLALYKGTRPGLAGIYNRVTRLIDRGPYNHCELVFTSVVSASASFLDGGVRFKQIGYTAAENWDFLTLPSVLEFKAFLWFTQHKGPPYGLRVIYSFPATSPAIAQISGFVVRLLWQP